GRWRKCVRACDQAEEILRDRCTGVAWEINTARTFAEWGLFWLGEVDELKRRLPLLLAEAERRGNLYALANLGTFAKPLVSIAADDPDAAEWDLRELTGAWSRKSFHVQHLTGLLGQGQIDLYRGHGTVAHQRLMQQWPALAGSLLLRVQQVRIFMRHLRARCALAASEQAADPGPLLRSAARDARGLEKEKIAWADALAQVLRAGISAACQDWERTVALLETAIARLDAVDMALFAASARRRLGVLLGGERGRRLVAEADSWMAGQGIRNPARMAILHTPGFPSGEVRS
ncbi:MAG: ATP-binding protein, partial [Planctomycetota bacterium]